ncbi:MAG: hypothetical protein JNM10_05495 [Planctomycetia bacterium]|nr:hypothetical protein [Planctomycetia bacterium]
MAGRGSRVLLASVIFTLLGTRLAGRALVAAPEAPLEERVEAAVAKGGEFLERWLAGPQGMADGRGFPPRFDEVMLGALAYLHARDGKDAPLAPRLHAYVSKWWRPTAQTYGVALALLFRAACLEQARRGEAEAWPAAHVRQRQGPDGPRELREMATWLRDARCRDGLWTYTPGGPGGGGDVSNAQFAALALFAARPHGVELPADALPRLATALEETAAPPEPEAPVATFTLARPSALTGRPVTAAQEGTLRFAAGVRATPFRYGPGGGSATGCSMSTTLGATLTALYGLAVARARPTPDGEKADVRRFEALVASGLAFAATHLRVDRNPTLIPLASGGGRRLRPSSPGCVVDDRCSQHALYTLFTSERCLTLAGVETVNGLDWHREGSLHLLAHQDADGAWRLTEGPLDSAKPVGPTPPIDTALAVLFLRRATRRVLDGAPPVVWAPPRPTPTTER